MLDMGFIHDIRKILALLPAKRQNLLFSATFSDDIKQLASRVVNNPVEVSATPANTTVSRIEQLLHPVDKTSKSALLAELIEKNDWQQVLVFCRTKHGANRLTKFLEGKKIRAAAIHGNKSQGARTRALDDFKQGTVRALIATDIAARGIDIDLLPQVVNFELPNVPEDYVHRIGRTGRAGADGHAISLVSAEEGKELNAIENLLGEHIPRTIISGFEPSPEVTTSRLRSQPQKPKKPKSAPTSRAPEGERSTRRPAASNTTHAGAVKPNTNKPTTGARRSQRRPPNATR